jgi:hypothetical protein
MNSNWKCQRAKVIGPGRAIGSRLVLFAVIFMFALLEPARAGRYVFSVRREKTYLNGREFLVKGLRCSNALISDSAAEQLIANLDTFTSYGVNTVGVYFMGSRFGDVKGYNKDGSLNHIYSDRMGRIIEAADRRGMVVLVGCLYWGGSRSKWEAWGREQADAAIANTVRWLKDNDYRNVLVDIDNEGMARRAKGFDSRQMVMAGKRIDRRCIIATNFKGAPPAEADLGIHFSREVAGKPYIDSESTPTNAPGGYWGTYSKVKGYYNYINIGIYSEQMKKNQIAKTIEHLDNGRGYMCASTWLQCVPPYGPNNRPGGDGSKDQPGIRWWLEFLRDRYGPYVPSAAAAGNSKGTVEEVGRWERFETVVRNSRNYQDPFADVVLKAVYTRPDGSKVDFQGFYDGGGIWRIRFMPDMLGLWRYEATFSDGQPGVSGKYRCVKSGVRGMISSFQDNPVWFGFKDNGPVLVRSFHVGDRFFAENFPASQRKVFLDWAQQQGYNMLSVASHYLNRRTEGRGAGWQTPNLWNTKNQKPNPGEYRRMEAIIDELARRRIIVFPFAGFFGRDSNYPTKPKEQSLYIRYTLARIGPYWNVMFNLAGPEPLLGGRGFLRGDLDRLGEEIKRVDPFGHLLSIHNRTGDDQFAQKAYTSYITLQGPKTTDRSRLSRGLLKNLHHSKPLYAQETLWANNKNHPKYSLEDLRKNAWVLMMSGAGLNFAENNGNSSSGFSGSLDLDQRNQSFHDAVKLVWDFFGTLPFHEMNPGQDLVDKGFCLARPGRRYLVYLPSEGTVNVSVSSGHYRVIWIDARNPSRRYDVGTTDDGRNLTPPTGGDDWLVHLIEGS